MSRPGSDFDREVALSLFSEWPWPIPEFSTRNTAADYLLRYLKRARVFSRITLTNGIWTCELANKTGSISFGTGESRPLAIARAVLHANVNPGRRHWPGPPRKWTKPMEPASHECAGCGVALNTARGSPGRARYCNLCGWHHIRGSRGPGQLRRFAG